ncbi:cytochrome PufQ [Tropicimonas sp. IMCC34043]|uniref:cytochrome PufQ n=1 Tax=Tropicimonas sp. IMCC34043 TaxID=2248760 RepID=UPI000E238C37|nr:cytochrome PufQ [Tropicimonas sp. IMCC34043]
MTDMSTDKPGSGRLPHAPVTEYRIYFAIIFLLAVPPAFVKWLRAIFVGDVAGIRRSVIDRAWNDAATITPLIFSA